MRRRLKKKDGLKKNGGSEYNIFFLKNNNIFHLCTIYFS